MSKIYFLTHIMHFFISILFWTMMPARANDVTINFTGTIKPASCVVDNTEYTVQMGNAGTANFSAPGDTSPPVKFFISIKCPQMQPNYITTTFTGTASSDPRYLALDDVSGGASGIAIRLLDKNDSLLSLNENSEVIQIQQGNIALPFSAQYVSLVHRHQIIAGIADGSNQIEYPGRLYRV